MWTKRLPRVSATDLETLCRTSIARHAFLKRTGSNLGTIALASLLNKDPTALPQPRDPKPRLEPGFSHRARRRMLERVQALNQMHYNSISDSEILTRIEQYEIAYRMETSVTELMDYQHRTPGRARSVWPGPQRCAICQQLPASPPTRRKGCALYQVTPLRLGPSWRTTGRHPKTSHEHQSSLGRAPRGPQTTRDPDETLVIWGDEFGRTACNSQGSITKKSFGRDHHPRCYSLWLAGDGIKGGMAFGETDDFAYNIARDGVHINGLHATILHCLGIVHERRTCRFPRTRFSTHQRCRQGDSSDLI
ncbi:MAG: hypothetical protein M2R45_02443 [Verrucomicrobia subdivision 3 bacterium]|nr:hypothetical protein [Limisphaerales bacterium]MCS1416352.1 hypothetical protein [Limisphaerales bacterium]